MDGRRGRLKHLAVRAFFRIIIGAYLRIRVRGAHHLPDSAYLICFNHPSWTDPLILIGYWPDLRRKLYIFGPREMDMSVGTRNAIIRWGGRGVPFRPGARDIVDVTRRATAVLKSDALLAVAGEGRLSDREGEALPLEVGVGHFALLAGVPVVPVAISGTRWIRLGKTVRITIGRPVTLDGSSRGRAGARELTDRVQSSLDELLREGRPDARPPGPFGRWLSEVFNERPWLTEGPDWAPNRRENLSHDGTRRPHPKATSAGGDDGDDGDERQ